MMPLFPSPSLKFRTVGFPQSGFKAGISDGAFPANWFAVILRALGCHRYSRRCVRDDALISTSVRAVSRSTPGALAPVRVMLSRSIFTYWPHPPHSQAHPDFTVSRLIPDAFAVPICIGLGNPRLVLSFPRCSFATCRPLRPRGTPRLPIPSTSPKTLAFNAGLKVSAFPLSSHSDSGEGIYFRGFTRVRLRCDLLLCLLSCRS
jgi:hypothetical protein